MTYYGMLREGTKGEGRVMRAGKSRKALCVWQSAPAAGGRLHPGGSDIPGAATVESGVQTGHPESISAQLLGDFALYTRVCIYTYIYIFSLTQKAGWGFWCSLCWCVCFMCLSVLPVLSQGISLMKINVQPCWVWGCGAVAASSLSLSELGGYFGQGQHWWGTQSMNLESRVYLQTPFSLSGRKGGSIFRSRHINGKGNKSSSFLALCVLQEVI